MNTPFPQCLTVPLMGLACLGAQGQELRITDVVPDSASGKVVIKYSSTAGESYALYRGETVSGITNLVGSSVGTGPESRFTNNVEGSMAFYRVGALSGSLAAYFPVAASVALVDAGSASVTVAFTKPFTGRLTYMAGGSALPSSVLNDGDYEALPGYLDLQEATQAEIPVLLTPRLGLEEDKTILLTLTQPGGANQPYSLKASLAHELMITSGDLGRYWGTMTVTNDFLLNPQSIKLALRRGFSGATEALIDPSPSPLFGGVFTLPVRLTPGAPFQFEGTASGSLTNQVTPQPLRWTLSVGTLVLTNQALTAPFTLVVGGLSASERTVEAKGNLLLNAAN